MPPKKNSKRSSSNMPPKKKNSKRSVQPSSSSTEPSNSTADPSAGNRGSTFNDFTSGVAQVAGATSSPSVENRRFNEYKNTVKAQLEEERQIAEAHIFAVYKKLEKNLGRAGCLVYHSSALGGEYGGSFVKAVEKATELEENSRTEAVSRKVTCGSNLSENMPPPTEYRRLRRSRSIEPVSTHTTILSHRPRQSISSDRLGLRTPATNGRTFNIGIATVTPHPQFSESRNNMTVLRKPNPGEVAISMCGSPLLVHGENRSENPSVTVPLSDGRVFQVLGRNSPFKEEMKKGLSEEAKMKLKQLKDFIGELV